MLLLVFKAWRVFRKKTKIVAAVLRGRGREGGGERGEGGGSGGKEQIHLEATLKGFLVFQAAHRQGQG